MCSGRAARALPSRPRAAAERVATMQKLEVLYEEEQLMWEVQQLASVPQEAMASITVAQVICETPKEAWDILPLSISDVAKETLTDKVYGKLYNAIRSGELGQNDPDLKKFNGVFSDLYIEKDVIYKLY